MTIDTVIELLRNNYEKAQKLKFVSYKLAWALFETWKYVDKVERGVKS